MLNRRRTPTVFIVTCGTILLALDTAEGVRRKEHRPISVNTPFLSSRLTDDTPLFRRSLTKNFLQGPTFIKYFRSISSVTRAPAITVNASIGPTHKNHSSRFDANTPQLRSSQPTPDDQGLSLSSYCEFDCGHELSGAHIYCWVPRLGPLTVVPFSAGGSSICHPRQSLYEQISSVGRAPDSLPFICKDLNDNSIVLRGKARNTPNNHPVR